MSIILKMTVDGDDVEMDNRGTWKGKAKDLVTLLNAEYPFNRLPEKDITAPYIPDQIGDVIDRIIADFGPLASVMMRAKAPEFKRGRIY